MSAWRTIRYRAEQEAERSAKKGIERMKWEDNIRKITPYTPGEQPNGRNVIKLNTNECPYPPAPGVEAALHGFDCSILKRYPDPDAALLVEALARRHGLSPKQVFVGVGSDDVLAMAFMTFFQSGKQRLGRITLWM